MGSYNAGKQFVCEWIRKHFAVTDTLLDVGACDGKWQQLLPEYTNLDAVEAFEPNLKHLSHYRNVFHADIRDFQYDWYDLIIFGDIVEHLTPEQAKAMLDYAKQRCKEMVIVVPYLYRQGAIYDNPYEVHIQDDLTAELFERRYPGYEVLCHPLEDYCYYHKPGVFKDD